MVQKLKCCYYHNQDKDVGPNRKGFNKNEYFN